MIVLTGLPLVLLAAGDSGPVSTTATTGESSRAAGAPLSPQKADGRLPDAAPQAKTNALGETIVGGAPIDTKTYVIGAEDVLNVSVWREAELSKQVIVRPDGKINLPMINEITAAGLTPEQLSNSIAQGLQKYIREPEVNVSVQQVNSKKYFIQGEINKPGSYSLVVPTTVLEGLGNAGGFHDFANTKKIIILRGTERLKFNYKDVTHGKHMEENILLQPGDEIIVP